jgi:N-acetylmuramoyl-L-alanine amidase
VLDLASIKSYKAFPLRDPERLVIDVTGDGGRAAEPSAESTGTGTQLKLEPAVDNGALAKVELQTPLTLPSKTPDRSNTDGSTLSLSRQLGLKIKTIAIDAGHGGHDPGATGRGGLKEKTVTLDIAKRLAALVKERLGCTVVMTRDTDVFIPLEQRPFIAKSKGADLFVSIHVNANRKRKARGIETYIQSLRASDRDAMATAARENSMSTKRLSELKSELDRIFADLAKDDKLEESLQLAHAVQGSLVGTMKPITGQVVNLGVKRAFFYVLINTEMPSILAEVGFISNTDEEKMLRMDSYRQSIAEALYQGVKKYVEARSPQNIAGI